MRLRDSEYQQSSPSGVGRTVFSKLLPYRGLGSGIPSALEEWPRIELIDEARGNQFSAVIRRPEAEWAVGTDPVIQLLYFLEAGPLPPSAIQKALGLKHRPTFRANYLYPALERELIEMTIPEAPSSRLQKYRLTAAGRALLQSLREEPPAP